jgi:anaphase-promoting complex subunit 4
VVLSRLIGLSKYHRLSPVLGLETKELKECLEVVDCLNLLGHKVLIHSGREVQEFFAFSKWLRHEIDLHAADPLSATAEEEMEKSDEIDYMPTLSYIRGAMTNSALHSFIKPSASAQLSEPDDLSTKEGSFYESYKTLLRRQQEQEKQGEAPILPTLGDLICRLSTRCDRVFKRIADTQKRGILHRSPLSLSPDCDERAIDIRTCAKDSSSPGVIQIASRSKRCPYKCE